MNFYEQVMKNKQVLTNTEYVELPVLGIKNNTDKAVEFILSDGSTKWIPVSCFNHGGGNVVNVKGWFAAKNGLFSHLSKETKLSITKN